jgi:hypothetical protein
MAGGVTNTLFSYILRTMMEHLKKFIIVTALLSVFAFHGTVFAEPDAIVTGKPGSDINFLPQDGKARIGSYTPLAQLPGIPSVIDPGVESGEAGSFTLPQYIRTIVRIAIGVIGVLAVVMIVVAGVQYMGSDMITEKESARSRLMGAVLGLILALSSVLLLRTINPQLTNLSIGDERFKESVDGKGEVINLPEELITHYEEEDSNLENSTVNASGISSACPGGIIKIDTVNQSGLLACKDIAENFKNMVAAAKKEGIILTAYGGRTMESQIALRKKNCGGNSQYNVYEKPSSQCRPPTARPGKSMHQLGLAFDIGENGKTICYPNKSSTCRNKGNKAFLWLEKNASTYKLYNLPSEAWHWSTNGK